MYSGESDTGVFPAICSRSCSILNNSIAITDECFWIADFDWTLTLNEEWNHSLNGSMLILTKNNGDKYTLTKQYKATTIMGVYKSNAYENSRF